MASPAGRGDRDSSVFVDLNEFTLCAGTGKPRNTGVIGNVHEGIVAQELKRQVDAVVLCLVVNGDTLTLLAAHKFDRLSVETTLDILEECFVLAVVDMVEFDESGVGLSHVFGPFALTYGLLCFRLLHL